MNVLKISATVGRERFHAHGPVDVVAAEFQRFLATVRADLPPIAKLDGADLGDCFTARGLPRPGWFSSSTEDVAMAILYGALVFRGQENMTAGDLIPLLQSACGLEKSVRLDRVFSIASGWIQKSGFKRGSRYGLTQRGVVHVEAAVLRQRKTHEI